jgi:hypothetical protein
MFTLDSVLQWMLCTWVAKYSELYMWVEVSLGQGVHGLFIITLSPWVRVLYVYVGCDALGFIIHVGCESSSATDTDSYMFYGKVLMLHIYVGVKVQVLHIYVGCEGPGATHICWL